MLISVFQTATFPPELWRECMRWATLPPSGRLPLHDPPTMLDPWPLGIPHAPYPYLRPEAAYSFEQSHLYPTKRALMLVSKAWADLAVEFMYESLIIDYFGVGGLERVVVALETPHDRPLKSWVKRVDIWVGKWATIVRKFETLARIGLPNLRVQHMFQQAESWAWEKTPTLLSEQPLHLVESSGAPIFARMTACSEAFGSLRCLTIVLASPLPNPVLLPSNLRQLTIISFAADFLQVQHFFSTRNSLAIPNLTHLMLHQSGGGPDRFMPSLTLINHIGPQLRHLTFMAHHDILDGTGVDLRTILGVCTQLTELVIPFLGGIQGADSGGYSHSLLQTLGIPMTLYASEPDYRSLLDVFSRREAFPKLSVIRIIPIDRDLPNMKAFQWLAPYALRLEGHGIRLEDHLGCRLLPVAVLENHNPLLPSDCLPIAT